jgi:hypothetical protein
MKYRVFWSPNAELQLETLLAKDEYRTSIARAARDVDGHLISDPLAFGESRYENVRVGFVLPLGVEYEILNDVFTVIVNGVWRISTH